MVFRCGHAVLICFAFLVIESENSLHYRCNIFRNGGGPFTACLPLLSLRGGDKAFEEMEQGERLFRRDEYEEDSEDREFRKRPIMIGRSGGGNSIRIIPAAPGQLLGDARWYPDDEIIEWMLIEPSRRTVTIPPRNHRPILVPEDEKKVHKAVAGSRDGERILVAPGLHRWDGTIKVRKGYWKGVHIEGEDGTVLWGQWLLGRHSAGSMRRAGGACNVSAIHESLLSIHAGPWLLDRCEFRCIGGQVLKMSEFAEVNCSRSTLGGMGPDGPLRATICVFLCDNANLGLLACSVAHSGNADGAGPETLGAGLVSAGEAHAHVINCTIVDHGVAVALHGNGSAVVARSLLKDNRVPSPREVEFWMLGSSKEGAFYISEGRNTALCLVNTRCEGGYTWYDAERPRHLNNYLFQGYTLAVPDGPEDSEELKDTGGAGPEKALREWRKKTMIDLDPSLFPDPFSHLYVYHVDEAPAEHLDPEDEDARPRDAYTYRRAPAHTVCYNCGERGHWGALCPLGQRALSERAVTMIEPQFARETGILDALEHRRRARAERRREAQGGHTPPDPEEEARKRDMRKKAEEMLRELGLDPKDAPKLRWNKLDLVPEWYNELKGRWEVRPDPFFGPMEGKIPRGVLETVVGDQEPPVPAEERGSGQAEGDGEDGEQLTVGQVECLNRMRQRDKLPPLTAEEWREERARLRKVYASEESEDDLWEL